MVVNDFFVIDAEQSVPSCQLRIKLLLCNSSLLSFFGIRSGCSCRSEVLLTIVDDGGVGFAAVGPDVAIVIA